MFAVMTSVLSASPQQIATALRRLLPLFDALCPAPAITQQFKRAEDDLLMLRKLPLIIAFVRASGVIFAGAFGLATHVIAVRRSLRRRGGSSGLWRERAGILVGRRSTGAMNGVAVELLMRL